MSVDTLFDKIAWELASAIWQMRRSIAPASSTIGQSQHRKPLAKGACRLDGSKMVGNRLI